MKSMTPCHLKIAGMYCTQCEKRIQKALQNLDGVQNVQVNYQKANARFEYDDKIISYENIVEAIKNEGYTIVKENQHSFPMNLFSYILSSYFSPRFFILAPHL